MVTLLVECNQIKRAVDLLRDACSSLSNASALLISLETLATKAPRKALQLLHRLHKQFKELPLVEVSRLMLTVRGPSAAPTGCNPSSALDVFPRWQSCRVLGCMEVTSRLSQTCAR